MPFIDLNSTNSNPATSSAGSSSNSNTFSTNASAVAASTTAANTNAGNSTYSAGANVSSNSLDKAQTPAGINFGLTPVTSNSTESFQDAQPILGSSTPSEQQNIQPIPVVDASNNAESSASKTTLTDGIREVRGVGWEEANQNLTNLQNKVSENLANFSNAPTSSENNSLNAVSANLENVPATQNITPANADANPIDTEVSQTSENVSWAGNNVSQPQGSVPQNLQNVSQNMPEVSQSIVADSAMNTAKTVDLNQDLEKSSTNLFDLNNIQAKAGNLPVLEAQNDEDTLDLAELKLGTESFDSAQTVPSLQATQQNDLTTEIPKVSEASSAEVNQESNQKTEALMPQEPLTEARNEQLLNQNLQEIEDKLNPDPILDVVPAADRKTDTLPTLLPAPNKALENINAQPASLATSNLAPLNKPNAVENLQLQSKNYTLNELLKQAVEKGASDLHLTADYRAMVRVDGKLEELQSQVLTHENIMSMLEQVVADHDHVDLRHDLDIDVSFSITNPNARFRVNIFYQRNTIGAVFRLIPAHIRTVEELKLPPVVKEFTSLPAGLVLVTGPTGSGKTTTLAALVNSINNTEPKHIITVEDPIEYVYPKGIGLVDQRAVFIDTPDWHTALRAVLRQDPNVVLIGEMRDVETMEAALTIAETGHLVFSTLHTNSASQTIDRIIDAFPEEKQGQVRTQLASVLMAVVSQRLVPVSGGGRRVVAEVMMVTPAIRNSIREQKVYQIDNIIQTSADLGMITMEKSLVNLVREGVISPEVAQNYANRPEEILAYLNKN